jgi:hypothetical protein
VRVGRVAIGLLYLVPQLHGAGLALRATTGAPVQAGAVLVAVVVTVNVAGGGMRSATFVQAFQYWLKLTALAVPAVFLLLAWQGDGRPALAGPAGPVFEAATTVQVDTDVRFVVEGEPVQVRVDGAARTLGPGPHALDSGSTVEFPAGAEVPHVEGVAPATGTSWVRPLSGAGGTEHPLYATYALVLATFLGTMGLPHVLVRFYTNPDGRAARRTTLGVLGAARRVLPAAVGCTARSAGCTSPSCCSRAARRGGARAAVAALAGDGRQLLQALLVAGAFAAFLSTSSACSSRRRACSRRTSCAATGPAARPGGSVPGSSSPQRHRCGGPRPRPAGRHRGRSPRSVGLAFAVAAVDVLPAAGARHLVARADGRRRGRRAPGRRRAVGAGGREHGGGAGRRRLGRGAAGPAGGLDGAHRVRRHGGRLPADPRVRAGRRRSHDAPAARPGRARAAGRPRRRRPLVASDDRSAQQDRSAAQPGLTGLVRPPRRPAA